MIVRSEEHLSNNRTGRMKWLQNTAFQQEVKQVNMAENCWVAIQNALQASSGSKMSED